MPTCINTLSITGDQKVAATILSKGFENSESDDWGLSPQSFSFLPFIKAQHPNSDWQDTLWTRWLEEKAQGKQHILNIEFESEGEPPTYAVDALIAWLNERELEYQLKLDYQPEGGEWTGEIKASSH
ncbi:MAG: hypothetical protein K6L73_03570 [Cellvibrionaceae bacterium]